MLLLGRTVAGRTGKSRLDLTSHVACSHNINHKLSLENTAFLANGFTANYTIAQTCDTAGCSVESLMTDLNSISSL